MYTIIFLLANIFYSKGKFLIDFTYNVGMYVF